MMMNDYQFQLRAMIQLLSCTYLAIEQNKTVALIVHKTIIFSTLFYYQNFNLKILFNNYIYYDHI